MRCSVTGIRLEHTLERKPNAPSIDRLDNFRGYEKDNVRLVSWIYNRTRGADSDEDVLEYLVYPLLEKNK